nr:MAG TPA: hypothetical protein [Caudoviricetes sp.]
MLLFRISPAYFFTLVLTLGISNISIKYCVAASWRDYIFSPSTRCP